MGHITIKEFSNELVEYLNKLGLTEEQVINIINDNLPQDLVDKVNNVEASLSEVNNNVNNVVEEVNNKMANSLNVLQNKVIDIMINLNITNSSGVDNSGYWFDDLSKEGNITFIEGLVVDTDRNRIFGAPGNVIFKQLDVPFTAKAVNVAIDFDNNFIESVSNFNVNAGESQVTIDNYVYKVE